MAKILLVDDDIYYRLALGSSLRRAGHEVHQVEDGEGAKKEIEGQTFDLVVSDIKMPGISGIELLKWIRSRSGPAVILITGFSELIETKAAAELGASDFFIKPFRSSEIEGSIERILKDDPSSASSASSASSDQNIDQDYCKIPLEDFISGSRISHDIYLKISNSRYLKVAHGGEDIAVDRIRNYKKEGLKHLFLSREDFSKYVGFHPPITRKPGAANDVSEKRQNTFLRYSAEVVLEQLFLEGADFQAFSEAKDFVQMTLETLQDSEPLIALLEALNSHAEHVYAQSLGTSVYSIMVARKMNWHTTPTLFKVSLAGIMHDVGLKEIDRSILNKSRAHLLAEEKSIYETHPIRGMELLNQINGIPADVILIAYQHHENWDGIGYPQKLSRNKTHPIARLVHVVDMFCDHTIESPGEIKFTPKEAITQMVRHHKDSLDPASFAALNGIFSHR